MSKKHLSTSKNKSDLYLASSLCDGLEDHDLSQLTTLLENKSADPNVLMPSHGVAPFHLIIGNESLEFAIEVTKLFLRHGGNPNVKSIDGMTPVHVAAAWGRVEILELLLANGGDPLCEDMDSCTPLIYAHQGDHKNAVTLLKKFCTQEKNDDEEPKYKLELDKILINNGEILAEYVPSEFASLNSLDICQTSIVTSNIESIPVNTTDYEPDNTSSEVFSDLNKQISIRKEYRNKLNKTNSTHHSNTISMSKERQSSDEEEENILNEIISEISTTVSSDISLTEKSLSNSRKKTRNFVNNYPKRKQIMMTFNRPLKDKENIEVFGKDKLNRRKSTLEVIKQQNKYCQSNNERFIKIIQQKKLAEKLDLGMKTPSKKSPKRLHAEKSFEINNWADETIISKSPNLMLKTVSDKKRITKLNDETIISKSPNLMLNTDSDRKRVAKSPLYEKRTSSSTKAKISKRFVKASDLKNISKNYSQCVNQNKYFSSHLNATKNNSNKYPKSMLKVNDTASDKTINLLSEDIQSQKKSKILGKSYFFPEIKEIKKNLAYDQVIKSIEKRNINSENDLTKKDNTLDEKDLNTSKAKNLTNISENSIRNCNNVLLNQSHIWSGIGLLESSKDLSSHSISQRKNEDELLQDDSLKNKSLSVLNCVSFNEADDNKSNVNSNNKKTLDSSLEFFDSRTKLSESSDSFLSIIKSISKTGDNTINTNLSSCDSVLSFKEDSFCIRPDVYNDQEKCIEEEYKYKDLEEGIHLVERRLCVTPSCASSEMNTSFYSCSTVRSEPIPIEILHLDNQTLRERLIDHGENPGPITNTTHHLYLKRLHRLESQHKLNKRKSPLHLSQNLNQIDSEKKLIRSSLLSIEWIKNLDDYETIEQQIFSEFFSPDPTRKWREGNCKNSFNYFLLDPRITRDLPRRSKHLSLSEKWETFLSAIFYVGKGKRSRPYAHLYDAFKLWVSRDQKKVNNRKIQRILDIWNAGEGVVVLHVFQNTIPVEAYTREAVIIETLGTKKLSNCKFGEYYGKLTTWRSKEKCEFGRYLLFKALQILLLEGERQIFPDNL